jgi:F0F1-type ATP synthase delta subunit
MYSIKQVSRKSAQLLANGQKSKALSLIRNYVKLERAKNQLDLIIERVMLEHYKITGELNLEITSAFNLDNNQISSIEGYISDMLKIPKNNINTTLNNDPSIIGGFKVKTPVVEVDRSIKTKLNQLKSIK